MVYLLLESLSGVDHSFLWSVLQVGEAFRDENVFDSSSPFASFDPLGVVPRARG